MDAAFVTVCSGYISQVSLAPTKARHLWRTSRKIMDAFDGRVPDDKPRLLTLSGVGTKTADVVLSQGFGQPAFAVDTHIHRSARRWGLSAETAGVEQVWRDLTQLFPKERWNDLHLQIIYCGREHCSARKHDASRCPVCSIL